MTAAVAALAALHVVQIVVRFGLGHDFIYGLLPTLNLDEERGFGTWFSSAALLAGALLAALVAHEHATRRARYTAHWWGGAALAALMSADEIVGLHERLGRVGAQLVVESGYFRWSWVVVGGALVGLVTVVYAGFLAALPRRTRWRFVGAGALFVGGAVGVEMVGARLWEIGGYNSLAYSLCVLVEETLEMAGVALAVHTVVHYAARALPALSAPPVRGTPVRRPASRPGRAPAATPVRAPAYTPVRQRTPRTASLTPPRHG